MLPAELPAFQAHIQNLVANGYTSQAIADLLEWIKIHRPGWRKEAVALSAIFEHLRCSELRGTVSFEQVNLTRNQINDRLLQLTDRLADAPPSAATYFFKKHWKKLAAVPVALGVLASVAEFTGYSVRDLKEKPPAKTTDSLVIQSPVNISTSGDNSPAVDAPGGDVRINYGGEDKGKSAEKPKKDTLK